MRQMLESLRLSLVRWLRAEESERPLLVCEEGAESDKGSTANRQIGRSDSQSATEAVLYDESLFERARTQWQFGDWNSLSKLETEVLRDHPERAKLALLAAAGHLQVNNPGSAKQMLRLAEEWGCSKKLIGQILVAGVHNSLGKAAALANQQSRAFGHFDKAINTGTPKGEQKLMRQARASEQLLQLGLSANQDVFHLSGSGTPSSPARLNAPITAAARHQSEKLRDEMKINIKEELKAELKKQNPNPYGHNRTLTPELNAALREFANKSLGLEGLKVTYVDYLATKAIQIEHLCVGRLATTIQDAVARQLVVQCVKGERIAILEIGALYGVSLAILYNHASTLFRESRVICLDPFDGYYGRALDALLNNPVNDQTFFRNMRLATVPDKDHTLIKHYSTAPAALEAASKEVFNLLIIDGDHSYEGVKFDFMNYFPLLQPGGYVIFDDYNAAEWPGVQQFVDQDLPAVPDFEWLGFISRTAVGRKKAA